MSSLYNIDQRISECIDAETGEILDAEALDALVMEREQKLEGVALWIKNLDADAVSYKAEKQAFAERQAQAERQAERLREWLANALQGQKMKTSRVMVSFRASKRVDIAEGAKLPEQYVTTKVTTAPDKVALKKALEAGEEIDGVALTTVSNIQIK